MTYINATEPHVAQTPKDTILRDATASLYRFRLQPGQEPTLSVPLLLVPSMINRWYVLDLQPGYSMAEALVERGIETYLLDWGVPQDEDRYMTWEEVLGRLGRMVRRVRRETGVEKIAMLGYCMGGTLASIYTALHPEQFAAFVNLTAPIDFSEGGMLRTLVDQRWFDSEAMTASGNLSPDQMQSGFTALRPTGQISKWIALFDRFTDAKFRSRFRGMETWSGDNIPFPAKAYHTYISELYQQNLLYRGEHYVGGERVDLGRIDCSLLTIVASRDNICPPPAAMALNELASSADAQVLNIKGGHVGAVVGSRAAKQLYPAIADWLEERFHRHSPTRLHTPD